MNYNLNLYKILFSTVINRYYKYVKENVNRSFKQNNLTKYYRNEDKRSTRPVRMRGFKKNFLLSNKQERALIYMEFKFYDN